MANENPPAGTRPTGVDILDTYLSYLVLAVPLTIWVAGTLSRNGRVFLEDVFAGIDELADAVNRLLVVGF